MLNVDESLNLNGKVCPMPAALTKKKLNQMETGQILEVYGDFELALENITTIAEKNGGKVLETETKKDFYRAFIEKL